MGQGRTHYIFGSDPLDIVNKHHSCTSSSTISKNMYNFTSLLLPGSMWLKQYAYDNNAVKYPCSGESLHRVPLNTWVACGLKWSMRIWSCGHKKLLGGPGRQLWKNMLLNGEFWQSKLETWKLQKIQGVTCFCIQTSSNGCREYWDVQPGWKWNPFNRWSLLVQS